MQAAAEKGPQTPSTVTAEKMVVAEKVVAEKVVAEKAPMVPDKAPIEKVGLVSEKGVERMALPQ